MKAWEGYKGKKWKDEINVADFVRNNYVQYDGDEKFLSKATKNTLDLEKKISDLKETYEEKGFPMDTDIIAGINSHEAGYIDEEKEIILGLQTNEAWKLAFMPNGGLRTAEQCLIENGYTPNKEIHDFYENTRPTVNDGIFNAYTEDIRKARKSHLVSGLPDSYSRGRIIGKYDRVALYGIDRLIAEKRKDLLKINLIDDDTIRLREEVNKQIRALKELHDMGLRYGVDLSKPAVNAYEAVQFTYLAFLATAKVINGAATSFGKIPIFLDIYIQRDLDLGIITEEYAQELIDQLVLKLRMIKFARTKGYNELYASNPTFITTSMGGVTKDGKSMITKTDFRFLHTLDTIGNSPEPNLTVLWHENISQSFKEYAMKMSIKYSSIQYEGVETMSKQGYDDMSCISCCVSPLNPEANVDNGEGHNIQYFGARINLLKALLYSINGGKDDLHKEMQVFKGTPINSEYLNLEEVMKKFDETLDWVVDIYVDAMNIIHYMTDKYNYESIQMALLPTKVKANMGFGICGFANVIDSLSAIKYAKVKPIRDKEGFVYDYETTGKFPRYGEDDDRVDSIAIEVLKMFHDKLSTHKLYKNAEATVSILTITSNIAYSKQCGNSPVHRGVKLTDDGTILEYPEYFSPGANPSNKAKGGFLENLNSLTKIPFEYANDGISLTIQGNPKMFGKTDEERISNLSSILDGYFKQGGQHMNLNILDYVEFKKKLLSGESFVFRVSGYAINTKDINEEFKTELLQRMFHTTY